MAADVNCPNHAALQQRTTEALEAAGWSILPEFTYHDCFGDDSDAAWALRAAEGRMAGHLRHLPDVLAISPEGRLHGFDVKTLSHPRRRNLAVEAAPFIEAIEARHEVAYVIGDFLRPLEDRVIDLTSLASPPFEIFMPKGCNNRDLRERAHELWPEIGHRYFNKDQIGGSGEPFLLWRECQVMEMPTFSAWISGDLPKQREIVMGGED